MPAAMRTLCARFSRSGPRLGGLGLEALTAADVTAFVLASCPGKARGPVKLTVTAPIGTQA